MLIDSPAREGLTGRAPAGRYARGPDSEAITTSPGRSAADDQPAWREDVPIDWPQDQYVEWRDFMQFLVLTSGALTAGQVWISGDDWLSRRRGLPEPRRIVSLDQLPAGGSLVFRYPGEVDACVLVRLAEHELAAYRPKCRHLSCVSFQSRKMGYCIAPVTRASSTCDRDRRRPARRTRRSRGSRSTSAGASCTRQASRSGRPEMRRPFSRDQRTTVIYGMLAVVLIIVVVQLWLLTGTMNAYLVGDHTVVRPAAAVSPVCCFLNVGRLRYVGRMERVTRGASHSSFNTR